jgi:uncharacterized membrane protein (UPF0127 family)
MVSRRRFLPLLALAAFALLTACGNNEAKTPVAPKTIQDRFAVKLGGRTVQMQVALLPNETQQGLMYRKSLGEDEGMLFVFDRPQQMSFWMRNTVIPLDIGYIDPAGELKEIYPMYPRDENPVGSRGRMQFALEMNQGWFRTAGVKPGARLDLVAVAQAIRERGLDPGAYGLR